MGYKIIGDFPCIMVYIESLIFKLNWESGNSKFSVSKPHLH